MTERLNEKNALQKIKLMNLPRLEQKISSIIIIMLETNKWGLAEYFFSIIQTCFKIKIVKEWLFADLLGTYLRFYLY